MELTLIKDLYCKWCPREQECDEHLSLKEKRECVACGGFAEDMLVLIKEEDYVKLSDDQSLPYYDSRQGNDERRKCLAYQRDMLKAGFRRVEL